MATICNGCGALLPDINTPGVHHQCPSDSLIGRPYYPQPLQPLKPLQGQKCDLCGSTAIDHTEMHCQMNRFNKQVQGSDLAKLHLGTKDGVANPPSDAPTTNKEGK